MKADPKTTRALGLCSGGLDSMLAAMVLRDQGVHVSWITFETPFFSSAKAVQASETLDIPLTVENITATYLRMLRNPHCGYGRNMNPCMDCHALMFQLAGRRMEERGFDFLFSGEVLGQRPMSQNRAALRYVEKRSGYDGRILRPLSARSLPETIPEKEGLVDRNRLMDITGRSRKPQMRLAEHFGVRDYPSPAGGCLLTDKGYSDRLRDLFTHQQDASERDFELLKFGRHFRLTEDAKAVVGRTQEDNEHILALTEPALDTVLHTAVFPGPTALMPGGGPKGATLLVAAICAGYSKAPNDAPVKVTVAKGSDRRTVPVLPIPPAEAKRYLV